MEQPPGAPAPVTSRRRGRVTRRRLIIGATLALLAIVVAAACGSSGRDLPVPIAGAVSPTRSTEPVNATGPFTLSSDAFPDGAVIPATYSCQGPSPELTWTGARPVGTTELALVVTDTTNDGFVHWFVAGIGAAESTSPSGGTPPNVAQLPNSAGTAGYSGPCPPAGETHTYQFEILALGAPAALPLDTAGKDAYAAVQDKVVGRAVLTGTFTGEVAGATTTTAPASTTTVP